MFAGLGGAFKDIRRDWSKMTQYRSKLTDYRPKLTDYRPKLAESRLQTKTISPSCLTTGKKLSDYRTKLTYYRTKLQVKAV